MIILDNFEISGIARIVMDKKMEWVRVSDPRGGWLWVRVAKRTGNILVTSHEDMINLVRKRLVNPDVYRLWTHGETLNIENMDVVEKEQYPDRDDDEL